ncbi:MAG TPA: hypothetical protein VF132_01690, partial [Rudaea sp.]
MNCTTEHSDSSRREVTSRPFTRAKSLRMRLLPFAAATFGLVSHAHAVCYVDAGAAGLGNGTSWTDAYIFLPFALINPACTEIWVAKGVYKPTLGTNRAVSFEISPGTAVYGGFAGGETMRESRAPTRNVTVLSGDIDNNDLQTAGNGVDATDHDIVGNNSYHVVTMTGSPATPISASTILDGFTITGGKADGALDSSGGAFYCSAVGIGSTCNPTIANVSFVGNTGRDG